MATNPDSSVKNLFKVTLKGPEGISHLTFSKNSISIGRLPECDLPLTHPGVSRTHMFIKCEAGLVFFQDNGAANGTFLNAKKVAPQTWVKLIPSDWIKVGNSDFFIKAESLEEVAKVPAHMQSQIIPEPTPPARPVAEPPVPAAIHHPAEPAYAVKAPIVEDNHPLIKTAEEKAKQAAKSIFNMADEKLQEAERFYRDMVKDAHQKAEELLNAQSAIAAEILQNAEQQAARMKANVEAEVRMEKENLLRATQEQHDLAKSEADRKITEATLKSEELISAAKTQSEETLTRAQAEAHAKVEAASAESKARVEMVNKELEVLKSSYETKKSELVTAQAQLEGLKESILSLQNEQAEAEKKAKDGIFLKDEMQDEIDKLQSRLGILEKGISEKTKTMDDLAANYEKARADYQTKLDEEFSSLKKDQAKHIRSQTESEAASLAIAKESFYKDLLQNQRPLILETIEKILESSADFVPNSKSAEYTEAVQKGMEEVFEGRLNAVTTENLMADKSAEAFKKERKTKMQWMTYGVITASIFFITVTMIKSRVDSRSIASMVETEKKDREADKVARKYNPAQNYEVRDTYTDSVIFTQNFVQAFNDKASQGLWLKNLQSYMFKTFRTPEEVTIKVIAVSQTLVQTLQEKKEAINPDFVDQNIQKMRDLEAERVAEIRDLLGTEVKFQAFKKAEKEFFDKQVVEMERSK